MISFIKTQLIKNRTLIRDNLVLFSAIAFTNLFNYVFRFYVGRSLGPEDFGTFEVLLSLLYLIIIPLMAVQTAISKFVAEFKTKEENNKINYFFSKSIINIGLFGFILGISFVLISPFLASFLKMSNIGPLIIIGLFMTFSFLVPVLRGFLQGLQKFKLLGLSFILEGITKIFIGIPLIYLGFGLNGAMLGFLLGFVFPFLIIYYFIKNLLGNVKKKFSSIKVYKYAFPVLLMLISLTAFYTLDVVLIKNLFDSASAGHYAALSLFGKIIFFSSMSISMVMFPKVSELASRNKNTKSLLFQSLWVVFGIGVVGSLFYFMIPEFIIKLLFGVEYLIVAHLLGLFGIMMTIYSLTYVLSFYNIALHRMKLLYILVFFNLLEIILIIKFHSSIFQIVVTLIILMILLFFSLIIYTIKNDKSINNYSGI
tara:strand:- start:490 stop:1764 length:1275 start_codon:yes stop_codon:yes gene_type:complete